MTQDELFRILRQKMMWLDGYASALSDLHGNKDVTHKLTQMADGTRQLLNTYEAEQVARNAASQQTEKETP